MSVRASKVRKTKGLGSLLKSLLWDISIITLRFIQNFRMTDLQMAKMKRNIAVIDFLTLNMKIFENDETLVHFYGKLVKDQQNVAETKEEILQDLVIQNHDKTRSKREVCTFASDLLEIATSRLNSLGIEGWFTKVKVWYLYFSYANDIVSEERLRKASRLLSEKIKDLSPDYITQKQILKLESNINAFVNTPGSSLQRDRLSPELTANFKAYLKNTETDILYIFEASSNYKESPHDFFADLVALCSRPEEEEATPTTLTFTITDSKTGLPLNNVEASIDKSEETPTSDGDGKVTYLKTKAGRGIAIFNKTGYEEHVAIVKIKAGTANTFNIAMDKC